MAAVDRRMLRRVRAVRVALVLDVALGLVAALLVLAQAVLLGSIIAATFGAARATSLVLPFVVLLAVVGCRAAAAWGFQTVGRSAAAHLISSLRLDIARSRLAVHHADEERAADIATLAIEGAGSLEALFTQYVPHVVLAVAIPVAVFALVAWLDPISAGLMLLTLPVALIFMWLLGHAAAARNRERWQTLSVLATHFSDVVRGLPTLRAFNRGTVQIRRIAEVSDAYRRATMETLRLSFLSGAILDLAGTLAVALIAVTIGVRLIAGAIEFAPGLIVLLLAPELYLPLRNLSAHYHASAEGRAVAGRLLDLADSPVAGGSARPPSPRRAAVRFEDVSYRYPGRAEEVLREVDLTLDPGEAVALVGESGAGKTTVAALLLLLLEPDAGRILAGGLDLRRCDPGAWRRQIAWVPQHPTLFRGTVAENVALGQPGADHERLRGACRSVCADEFIGLLPAGYETTIGDGGRVLSAGERQRIALARALVRDASLLVLDEPTAHLDEDAARRVLATLESRRRMQTILLITHREDVAAVADRVIRLEGGTVSAEPPALAGTA